MTKLTNLEIITMAWAMGWSATVELYDHEQGNLRGQIINIGNASILLQSGRYISTMDLILPNTKILGFKYMGQLGGSEPIPEGQKFRVKETGEIGIMKRLQPPNWIGRISLDLEEGVVLELNKSEIEPVFE